MTRKKYKIYGQCCLRSKADNACIIHSAHPCIIHYNSFWLGLQSWLLHNQWSSLGIVAFNMCPTYRGSMETAGWSSKALLSCCWLMRYALYCKTHTALSLKITLNCLQQCCFTILLDPSRFYLNLLFLLSHYPQTLTFIWLFSTKRKGSIRVCFQVKWLCRRYLSALMGSNINVTPCQKSNFNLYLVRRDAPAQSEHHSLLFTASLFFIWWKMPHRQDSLVRQRFLICIRR